MSASLEEYRSRLREALTTINQMKAKLEAVAKARTEPIAIIGMACRFPGGASTPEAFFGTLEAGRDTVTEVPAERWSLGPMSDDPAARGTRWGAFVRGVDLFDADFFAITPREASRLDPQQRLLLELAWEALERAGQVPGGLIGSRTGVFLGLMTNDYALLDASAGREQQDAYSATGNGHCFPAGRLSYTLGLQGPSLVVDTACSSSLVAAHLACQSLRSRESDMALVGGANLMLSPDTTGLFAKTRALSPDGRCKTFDASANGYVRGEGAGVLVLKRLSDAQRDGDPILALIRGSAVNQDGRSTGLTTPNVLAQEALLRAALDNAGVSASDIGYVETHGTGTPLGDPIEVDALRAVVGSPRPDGARCVLGAVKTNIGHLEAAAGVASLIKAVMVLRHGRIPPNLHFRALNPRIDLEGTSLEIAARGTTWDRGATPRRAGVSAFGMSGTNAHLILEQAPPEETRAPAKEASAYVLPLSARSKGALVGVASAYAERLSSDDGDALADIVYTASVRRAHHDHRLAAVGRTRPELAALLASYASGEATPGALQAGASSQERARVVFVFSGQGSQWAGMGRGLLAEAPVFRAKLEECAELFGRHVSWSLLDVLAAGEDGSRLGDTEVAQPAIFAIQVALAELLKSWGIVPEAVIGHSVGEIAAAHVAGALPLAEAVRLAALRGRIMQKATGLGKMAWVALPAEDAAKAIAGQADRLAIAAVNDPTSVVLSGESGALEAIVAELSRRGVASRPLRVSYAFHSPQMDPLARELVEALGPVDVKPFAIPMYSTVTGAPLTAEALGAAYWGRNVRQTVELARAVAAPPSSGRRLLLEVGPHPVLQANLQQCVSAERTADVVSTLRRGGEELQSMLEALGALYARGVEVDWKRVYPAPGRTVLLPAYPWQHQRHWIEGSTEGQHGQEAEARDPLDDCVYERQWRRKDRADAPAETTSPEGAWLLFIDRAGVGKSLAALLRERGEACVVVARGERYERLEPGLHRIDPSSRDDYRRLLEEAFGNARRCRGVVHLFSLDTTPWDEMKAESLEADRGLGSESVLFLAQALLRQGWRDTPRLCLVTRNAQAIGAAPATTSPMQAMPWGLARTLVIEHPEMECLCVDLDPERSEDEVRALLGELGATDGEDQIALRGGKRFVARLCRSSFDAAPALPFHFDADASYLVTGGLGGLGIAAAQWMVEQGARHVALMSRREPSEEVRAQLRAMEASGAQVLVLSGDVSRRADTEAALQVIDAQMPPLRGVLHAAGVVDDHTLLELSAEHLRRVLGPKMHGAWNLHALTASRTLDFFVLYSSVASLIGSPGQANYGAANAFMDSFAHARRARGLPATSIHWGPFTDVGLAAAQANRGARMSERGVVGLEPAQGNLALGRLLERPRAEVGIVRFDVRHWLQFYPQMANHPYLSELERGPGARPQQLFRATLEAAPPSEWSRLLEGHVREQVGRVMHIDPASIDGSVSFRDFGIDSLMSLEVRNRLEASLGLRLPATLLFTHPNLDALTQNLLEELSLTRPADGAPREVATITAPSLQDGEAEPIAIVGIACRFPGGAADPEAFWRMMLDGVDAVREVTPARWPAELIPEDRPGARYASLLEGLDRFDAAFFGISPREAEALDPQQRMLLEVAWEALEDAGQRPDRLAGTRTGVFVGITALDYQRIVMSGPEHLDAYGAMGTMLATAAGRLSYVLGLQGPAVALDTACSSSLVAIHLACQSLRSGESNLALAGGANALLAWQNMVALATMQALSPDGRCKTLDARANGYVRGEGCGVVVLKRQSDALRDGDPILGLIRGSAVNQDGRSTGLTAPNLLAQEALLRQALESARMSADEVDYIEMHGTGTPLGDPIEADALKLVFGRPRNDGNSCFLGAVKTNLGHLESAAGVAGLIKAVLVLQRGTIPKNLHFRALNPRISFEGTPFVIPTENTPFPRSARPRRAGVSAFGISGTNAHVIVEEAPVVERAPSQEASAYLLPLSAKSHEALISMARAHAERLDAPEDLSLHDFAYTACVRRMHHEHRLAVVGRTRHELAQSLQAFSRGDKPAGVVTGRLPPQGRPKLVFVFPGQGSQWLGMGRQLLREQPAFRSALQVCDVAIQRESGFSVLHELTAEEGSSRLGEIDVVQPVLFALEVALASLWRSWGIIPDCVVGHSMGEVAAAHVAGMLHLDDAAKIICRRSRLLRRISGKGAMALVELDMADASRAIEGHADTLDIAVSNGPRSTVLAGQPAALEQVLATLEQRGVFCRRVKVDVASHSPQVDPLLQELLSTLADIRPSQGLLPMLSTVTAAPLRGTELDPAYWAANLRKPVRFSHVTQALVSDGFLSFLEISPHPILLPAIEENLRHASVSGHAIASLRRDNDELRCMLDALASLYSTGHQVDWDTLFPHGGRCLPLPAYPWQRQRHWMAPLPQPTNTRGHRSKPGDHPLLGSPFTTAAQRNTWFWHAHLRLEDVPYLKDHRIGGVVVLPGAAYVEAALAASRERLGTGGIVLEDMSFVTPLVLREGEPVSIEATLTREGPDAWSFRLSSLTQCNDDAQSTEPTWTLHATARLGPEQSGQLRAPGEAPAQIRGRLGTQVSLEELERAQIRRGLEVGPAFRGLREAWRAGPEVLGRVRLPEELSAQVSAYVIHPALLDAALRAPLAAISMEEAGPRALASIRRIRFRERAGREAWSYGRLGDSDGAEASVTLLDDAGQTLCEIEGLQTRPLDRGALGHDPYAGLYFASQWEKTTPLPAPARGTSPGRWLLLCDEAGFGERVRALLVERGADVVCAWARGTRSTTAARTEVDPASPDGIALFLGEALRGGAPFTGIVHCWGLEPASRAAIDLASLESAAENGCGSALHVVQALTRTAIRDMPRLWILVRGTQAVPQEPRDILVAQAPLWGLGRTIGMEYPELRCTRVDLDPAEPRGEAEALLRELLSAGPEEEIALRGESHYAARLARELPTRAGADAARIRPDASYLITGGLGGLGLLAARWLATEGARHLVLMGRQGIATQAQTAAISALEAEGVEVLIARADVADRGQLEEALREVDARMPPLRGVIHAAGVLDDGALDQQNLERFRRVLGPKVLGGWNLHQQTAHRPLDFFVLYSSMAALLGSPGLGNYVAANAFLDALAHHRRGSGLVATSVNWGLFADVGMGVKAEGIGRTSRHGIQGLAPEEGAAVLLRALREGWTQMGVASVDFRRWLESHPHAAASPRFGPLIRASQGAHDAPRAQDTALVDALAHAAPADRAALLEQFVREALGEILRIDPMRIDRLAPLRAMGIDSLMSLELRNRLEAALGIKLSTTLVWSRPNVSAMAKHLLETLAERHDATGSPPQQDTPAAPAPEATTPNDDLLASFDESMRRIKGRRRS
ncbi:type I polyketide synthase [Polyangium aurulentum]|uniref:type I polyketide synthase n=1 Tax=Polyangium aurulentum TaxID=2567896 RepID=UPI00200D947E|nr:type I polyketide synthase [Polyangium aurulentum]UQA61056.1 SDR family NAD(P)-dependent oxidoreductase [Polyangium aurulentum]